MSSPRASVQLGPHRVPSNIIIWVRHCVSRAVLDLAYPSCFDIGFRLKAVERLGALGAWKRRRIT
jgi:hypothetical protein